MEKNIVITGKQQYHLCLLLAVILLLFLTGKPAAAAVEGFIAKDSSGTYHQYCYDELLNSYALNATGKSNGLYEDFVSKKPVALLDCTGGYIDYSSVLEAYARALIRGDDFILNNYTESGAAREAVLPEFVKVVNYDSGKLERLKKSITDNGKEGDNILTEAESDPESADQEEMITTSTPLTGSPTISLPAALKWAEGNKAHRSFIDIAPLYWEYGEKIGIRPEVLYAQAAYETGFGSFSGLVPSEYNNWAGIKIGSSSGDEPEDYEQFDTPAEGARAHFNHIAAYVGLDPLGEPHDRYYVIVRASWAGTIETVEELSGIWAPSSTYHQRIVEMLAEMTDN